MKMSEMPVTPCFANIDQEDTHPAGQVDRGTKRSLHTSPPTTKANVHSSGVNAHKIELRLTKTDELNPKKQKLSNSPKKTPSTDPTVIPNSVHLT